MLAAAWTVILLWAVGVPIFYAVLIFTTTASSGRKAGSHRLLRSSLGVLVGDYRPAAMWWELVAVTQKLLLTGFLALYEPGSWYQLFLAVIVALSAFVLQTLVAPYSTAQDNLFSSLTAFALVPVFLGSLGLQTEALLASLGQPADPTRELVLLFTFTLLVIFAALGFFLKELNDATEMVLVRATSQPPVLTLSNGKRWHLFLSHNWANQDAVATIKRQLQLLLPGVCVFLDVDDLESIDELEEYVEASQAMLVMHGSDKYYASFNCQREIAAAKRLDLPLVRVHETDRNKNGTPLATLKQAASRRLSRQHTDFLFAGGEVVPWHRLKDFQLASLAMIAEQLLLATPAYAREAAVPLYVRHGVAWSRPHFQTPLSLYCSEHNPPADEVAREIGETFEDVLRIDSAAAGASWLLLLDAESFTGDAGARLTAELRAVMQAGNPSVLVVYAPADGEFGEIISATPRELVGLGLFGPLAIEWHSGALRTVSVRLLARALGAQMDGQGHWRGCTSGNSSVRTCMPRKALLLGADRSIEREANMPRGGGLASVVSELCGRLARRLLRRRGEQSGNVQETEDGVKAFELIAKGNTVVVEDRPSSGPLPAFGMR